MTAATRIAITGATGFLGRHLVARLAGRHALVCISRSGSAPDGHEGVAVDITGLDCDATVARLTAALQGCAAVVHAAGMVSHDPADAAALFAVHVTGTERVLAAARAAGVPRAVHIGSSGTIAVSTRPVAVYESAVEGDGGAAVLQTISRWPYYRSKWLADDAALAAHGPDLSVLVLSPGLLLGPGDDAQGAASRPARLFLDQGIPAVPEGGPCFVDVRDVAAAIEAALTRGAGGRRILLGAANWPWSQFYGALARITGRDQPRLRAPGRLSRLAARSLPGLFDDDLGLPLDPEELDLASHYWYARWDRAAADLGFSPRDPLRTLEDTVADILDQRRRGWQLYGRPA